MDWGERRRVYAKRRYYAGSLDLSLDAQLQTSATSDRDESLVISATCSSGRDLGEFYHVFGAETVAGPDRRDRPVPRGLVSFSQVRLLLYPVRGAGTLDGRLSLRTPDGVLINCTFSGVVRDPSDTCIHADAGQLRVPKLRAYITPNYETVSSRYRWLGEQQFVCFGELVLRKAPGYECQASLTFDQYVALALPPAPRLEPSLGEGGRGQLVSP